MKKNFLITGIIIISLLIFLIFYIMNFKTVNPLKKIEISNIKEITIYNPAEGFTISDKDDIQTLFEFLQSMELRNKRDNNRVGFAFLISIKLKSEEIIDMNILYTDIMIDNQNYAPTKDYCTSTRVIFDKLAEKYSGASE